MVKGPDRDDRVVSGLFIRGSKVRRNVKIKGAHVVKNVVPLVPLDFVVFDQPVFIGHNSEHQLLIKRVDLSHLYRLVVLLKYIVVRKAIFPSSFKLRPGTREPFTHRIDVNSPCTGLHCLVQRISGIKGRTRPDNQVM